MSWFYVRFGVEFPTFGLVSVAHSFQLHFVMHAFIAVFFIYYSFYVHCICSGDDVFFLLSHWLPINISMTKIQYETDLPQLVVMQLNVLAIFHEDEFTGSVRIKVESTDTIELVAEQIMEELGLECPPLVIFGGKNLSSESTLAEFGIANDDMITAMIVTAMMLPRYGCYPPTIGGRYERL